MFMKTTYFNLYLFILFFISSTAYAQKEANTWYFGEKAGITFEKGLPQKLDDGQLSTREGCATISDKNGNLLFYTDGIKVWNKNHDIISDTDKEGLLGNPSSTQSGVIVPAPNASHKYYIFAVDEEGGKNGLSYSVLDMEAGNGLGKITQKNVILISPVAEKLTAVKHQNKTDYWIIAHKWNSNEYYAYILTEKGMKLAPTISAVGMYMGDIMVKDEKDAINAIGYLKSSPNGKKLASAVYGKYSSELLDFDNQTGKISAAITLEEPNKLLHYGVEFSSDNSKLYISTGATGSIFQYDISSNNADKILASKQNINPNPSEDNVWALQLGPDGRIYVSIGNHNYLGVIENPNLAGRKSNYKKDGVFLGYRARCLLGLPTFMQTYFEDRENISIKAGVFTSPSKKILNSISKRTGNNILFLYKEIYVSPNTYPQLEAIAQRMQNNTNLKIEISGHTDALGNAKENLELAQKRAFGIAYFLKHKGISEDRIKIISYGETKPIADNETEEGRKQNRRVEIRFEE